MNDITKHKWGSISLIGCEVLDDGDIEIEQEDDAFWLNKDDAIAIAKHFYEQSTALGRLAFITSIIDRPIDPTLMGAIPQSENTYKSLNLDSVKEIKDSELFNNEVDSHG